ncbi:nitroreductase [Candidatus Poribacteria bacterium]|nr:MAG: nitroreductase [Candidatus Poribacteria bacterium]
MTQISVNGNEKLSVMEAIQSRRTIFKFKPDPIPKDILENLLFAGIWAPNHHLTEPWRFTVIGEETKLKLAERYRELQIEKVMSNLDKKTRLIELNLAEIGERGYQKFMSKPTIVVISCIQDGNEQRQREDYASACCAMLNIQLAGWEQGIGMQWSTGKITTEKPTYDLLGINPENEYIIGFYYMGYPEVIPTPKRKPLNQVLRWVD